MSVEEGVELKLQRADGRRQGTFLGSDLRMGVVLVLEREDPQCALELAGAPGTAAVTVHYLLPGPPLV